MARALTSAAGSCRRAVLLALWSLAAGLLALFPMIGLALERAPLRAYLVVLTGPVFIVWRTWLAVVSRFGRRSVEWVRTPRREGDR